MKRPAIQIGIALVWLSVAVYFVRVEAYPGLFAKTVQGYRQILRDAPLVVDSWMRVKVGDADVGYSHTSVNTDEADPDAQYVMVNQTKLELSIMGQHEQVMVMADVALDTLYRLTRFSLNISSRAYRALIQGERTDADQFRVTLSTGATRQVLNVSIPDDVVIYSPMTEMALSHLRPGQTQRIRTFDPASLSVMDVVIRAIRREKLNLQGRDHDTTLMTVEYNGLPVRSWVDGDGRVLKQMTPFGWTMERCTAAEARQIGAGEVTGQDLLSAAAVPCSGTIEDPRHRDEVRLRLHGIGLDPALLASSRQEVVQTHDRTMDLVLHRQPWPGVRTEHADGPETMSAFLAPTPFIQSGDEKMIRQAKRIAGDLENPVEVARAISEWVDEHVANNPAVSLPSALDVLQQLEGDCNEHTYLFVGLARAAGLPAKVKVGLVYMDGAFYYHAWPAVYVGEWVEMDPTLGQLTVDATHVALLEGELANQMKLLSVVGQLRAEVLPDDVI